MTQPCRRLFPVLFLLVLPGARAQVAVESGSLPDGEHSQFAAASLAFEQQDYAAARDGFRAAIDQGSDGPAALYNLAVSLYRLGEYPEAEQSFRALGDQFPQMRSLADYNTGLAVVRQGRSADARAWFELAVLADDEQIARLADAMLARLPAEVAPARADWLRYVDISLGNDDNVALVDPLALPAGESTDSGFGEFQFYASGPIGTTDHWQLTTNAFLLHYPGAGSYNQQLFDIAARFEQELGGWQLAAGPQFGRIYIDGDGFEQSIGGSIELSRPLRLPGAELNLRFSFDKADELDLEYAYIDGQRRMALVGIDHRFDRVRWLVDFRLIADDRAGAGVSADRKLLRSRLRRSFGVFWTGELILEYRDTSYDRLAPARKEQRDRIGLVASRNVGAGMDLAIRYWHTDNDASDSLYSYSRRRLAIGLSWLF